VKQHLALIALILVACEPAPDSGPETTPPDSPAETGETGPDETAPPDETGETGETEPPDETGETGDDTGDPGETGDTGEPIETMIEKLDPWFQPAVRFSPDPLVDGAPVTITYEGRMVGKAKQLELRYGFDHSSPIWPEEMTATKTGFEVTMDVPKGSLALHVDFANPETDERDDRTGLGYHVATRFPYLGPWLTWSTTATPGSGIRVGWETTQPCLGVLEYGLTDALGSWAAGSYEDTVHHVEVTGLSAGDTLHYRVWDSRGQVSDTYSYELPDVTGPYSFIALSDMQPYTTDGRLVDTAAELVSSHSDAAFAMIAGDIVGWDHPASWWTSLHIMRELWPTVPIVPAAGNHDGYGSTTTFWGFDRYLTPPIASTGEPWYSIDFGTTRLISLYSNDPVTMAQGGDQYDWLEIDLASCWHSGARVCDWVFAFSHVPPYNTGTRHFWEQEDVREVTGLFDGEVDWHVAGHEHMYQRFLPLQYESTVAFSESYGVGSDDGVGFMTLPTAGSGPGGGLIATHDPDAGVRDLLAFPELAWNDKSIDSEMGFVRVDVDGTDLSFTSWATGPSSKVEPAEVLETYTYSR